MGWSIADQAAAFLSGLFRGQKTAVASIPVVLASDQTLTVSAAAQVRTAAATVAQVNASATAATLLAANANRVGAIIENDSTGVLYIKFGADAAETDRTCQLLPGDIFTMTNSVIYTGIITGIWTSASGAANVTELE